MRREKEDFAVKIQKVKWSGNLHRGVRKGKTLKRYNSSSEEQPLTMSGGVNGGEASSAGGLREVDSQPGATGTQLTTVHGPRPWKPHMSNRVADGYFPEVPLVTEASGSMCMVLSLAQGLDLGHKDGQPFIWISGTHQRKGGNLKLTAYLLFLWFSANKDIPWRDLILNFKSDLI